MKNLQLTLFCIGYGYSAQALAALLGDRARIVATTRSAEKAESMAAMGIEPMVLAEGADVQKPPENAFWLISSPPDDEGCPAFRLFGQYAGMAEWIGYLSTTGVYGDLAGRWAFEWSDVRPQSVQGRRRVVAENQWSTTGGPLHVFRLPGIYGPGRCSLDRLRKGTARRIVKPGHVFSRIHVEDIASCLLASMTRPNPGRVYHPCDDEPAPPQDVTAFAANLLGVPVPPDVQMADANLSPMGKRFYDECKRVSNARTKSELGWYPDYSNYRAGLEAIFHAEE